MVTTQGNEVQQAEELLSTARSQREEAHARWFASVKSLAAIDSDLKELELDLEQVLDHPKRKKSLHEKRRKLEADREDILRELPLLEKDAKAARNLEDESFADLQLSIRRALQSEGAEIGTQIRTLISDLNERFRRWQELGEEDRRARDTILSTDSLRTHEVPTWSWATGIDQAFEGALAEVIRERARCEATLGRREAALQS